MSFAAILSRLNLQGLLGLVASVGFAILLVGAKIDARHWRKESTRNEQLYRREQSARADTVASYRAAAEEARAADQAVAERAAEQQRAINERSNDDLEKRLADARARAASISVGSLQREARAASADSSGSRAAPVPGVPASPRSPAQAAGQDGLSPSAQDFSLEERLIATEQAIQLDELIKWVRQQAAIPVNGGSGTSQPAVSNGRAAARALDGY